MKFQPELTPGEVIDNERLRQIFECGPQGGMRRSLKTNTLVLVSNHVKSVYDDRWNENGILHYTGMGQEGPQSLDFMQNKTLAESATNGVDVFLFEVFEVQKYTFFGEVSLAEEPYQETQPDLNDNPRKVWMFPLSLANNQQPPVISQGIFQKTRDKKAKSLKRLSDEEVKKRAISAPNKAGVQKTISIQYVRDQNVSEYTKRRADGHCQLCKEPAPFITKNDEPYLETHHIKWLADGGKDSISNTVALCPNCHRKMHSLNLESDRRILLNDVITTS